LRRVRGGVGYLAKASGHGSQQQGQGEGRVYWFHSFWFVECLYLVVENKHTADALALGIVVMSRRECLPCS
jgi:hypothetical protein